MCTTLSEKWASAGKWNGREHGVWEQREMKRMIANIVWTETARPIVCRRRRLLAQLARTKTALLSKISSRKMAAFQMHGIWPMNSEQRRRICYGVNLFLLSCPHLALMAKKCFEFYVLGGWMKMFKTILKPFDSQVMVPYEYISTDIYASKKSKIWWQFTENKTGL